MKLTLASYWRSSCSWRVRIGLNLKGLDFAYRFLQPMDGAETLRNTQASIAYCKAHPAWRLSLQTHKLLGIP